MKKGFSNKLSAAEAERLAILNEELAEAQQVISKILRHGFTSVHPRGGLNNRALLAAELGDVVASIDLVHRAGDVSGTQIATGATCKPESWRRYAHHQPKKLLAAVEEACEAREGRLRGRS